MEPGPEPSPAPRMETRPHCCGRKSAAHWARVSAGLVTVSPAANGNGMEGRGWGAESRREWKWKGGEELSPAANGRVSLVLLYTKIGASLRHEDESHAANGTLHASLRHKKRGALGAGVGGARDGVAEGPGRGEDLEVVAALQLGPIQSID